MMIDINVTRAGANLIERKSIYKHLQIHLQKKSRLKSGDFSRLFGCKWVVNGFVNGNWVMSTHLQTHLQAPFTLTERV